MSARVGTIRKKALIDSGTLSPNPWDLPLSGQNGWPTLKALERRTGLRRGCDPSADSNAGTARGGCCRGRLNTTPTTSSGLSLFRAKNGLDNGVHFRVLIDPR